jgi:hypothetical protein
MQTECCACGATVSVGCVRCATCGGTSFRIAKAPIVRGVVGARGPSAAPATCISCGSLLSSATATCGACGGRPARALSDAELLAELRDLVSRPRPTAEQERADDAHRDARRFAMSRAGLVDLDRPVAPSRRAAWLNGPMGPCLVPLPSAAEARAVADRVNHEFERVDRAMGRAW